MHDWIWIMVFLCSLNKPVQCQAVVTVVLSCGILISETNVGDLWITFFSQLLSKRKPPKSSEMNVSAHCSSQESFSLNGTGFSPTHSNKWCNLWLAIIVDFNCARSYTSEGHNLQPSNQTTSNLDGVTWFSARLLNKSEDDKVTIMIVCCLYFPSLSDSVSVY